MLNVTLLLGVTLLLLPFFFKIELLEACEQQLPDSNLNVADDLRDPTLT